MSRTSPPIEGPWFITERAAREFGQLMGYPADSDLEREKTELHQLSARAHKVRDQPNGLELWRVWVSSTDRVSLLVGAPATRFPGAKPALVQVLPDRARARKRTRKSEG